MAEKSKRKTYVGISAEQPMITNDVTTSLGANNDGLLKSLDICIPVCVYSYEREKHTVVVMPLIKQAYFKKKWQYIARVPFEVRIKAVQCGGFSIDFPIFVGDTGWVISGDRDTTFLKEEDSPTVLVLGNDRELGVVEDVLPQPAKQPRVHALPDGFFIPDNWGKWEYKRFKDSEDLKIDDALYIGTSFYDEDKEHAEDSSEDENKKDSEEDKKYPNEDSDDGTYEGNPSASLVLTRDGSVNLLSSAKGSAKKKTHFKIKRDKVGLKILNEGNTVKLWDKIESEVSIDDGLSFKCTGKKSNCSFLLDTNGLEIKYDAGGAANGKSAIVTLSPSLDLNISTTGDVSLTAGNVTTDCKNIKATGKDVTFNLGNVTGTVGKMTINSSADLDIRSSGRVSVASEEGVSIGSAGNIDVGGIGKDGNINITTFGGSVNISATGGGENSVMSLETNNGTIKIGKDGMEFNSDTITFNGDINFNTTTGKLNDKDFISGGGLIIS